MLFPERHAGVENAFRECIARISPVGILNRGRFTGWIAHLSKYNLTTLINDE
jgi:hypothetical protein